MWDVGDKTFHLNKTQQQKSLKYNFPYRSNCCKGTVPYINSEFLKFTEREY